MAGATLRFRRHLAVCVLLIVVNELHLSVRLSGGSAGRSKSGAASFAMSAALVVVASQQDPIATEPTGSADLPTTSLLNDDNDDDPGLLGTILNYLDYYLPTLNFNYTIVKDRHFDNGQLDRDVELYYNEQFAPNMTLDQLQLVAAKAAIRMAPIPLHTSWGYERRQDLRLGSYPVQSDARCSAHLAQLANRLDKLASNPGADGEQSQQKQAASAEQLGGQFAIPPSQLRLAAHQSTPVENFEAQVLYKSTDIELMRYLDTFGKVPQDFLRGNTKWYGSYSGCLDTKLKADPKLGGGGTKRIKFRYCMGSLKSSAWPINGAHNGSHQSEDRKKWIDYGVGTHDLNLENFFIRVGVCLPESCDSSALNYSLDNVRSIEKLIKFNLMKPFNSDHYYLTDLYCLPDQRSPLRSIPLLGKLLILAALGWMALIGLATCVHLNVERFYTKAVKEIRRQQAATEAKRAKAVAKALAAATSSSAAAAGELGEKSSTESEEEEDEHENDNNEFKESDILHIKHYWVWLNVYIWDHSKRLVKGIDLIACLSLYSNWLKYTNRLKLAVAQLHAEEERRERIRKRDQQLVEEVAKSSLLQRKTRSDNTENTTTNDNDKRVGGPKLITGMVVGGKGMSGSGADNVSGGSAQRLTATGPSSQEVLVNTAAGGGQQQSTTSAANGGHVTTEVEDQLFDRELNKRLEAQDDSDEYESDFVKQRVDTSSLNALKVIALVWIIAGHCIFYLGSAISNGAILKLYLRQLPAFALANGALYITELFFVITGCLTTYLAFKYNTYTLSADGRESAAAEVASSRSITGESQAKGRSVVELEMTEQQEVKKQGGRMYAHSQHHQPELRKMVTDSGGDSTQVEQAPARLLRGRGGGGGGRRRRRRKGSSHSSFSSSALQQGPVYMESRMLKIPFWVMVIVNRYLRILPTYLVVYAFVRLVSVYVGGYGQLWDYAVSTNSIRRRCTQESWLPVLTLTTNFVDIYSHCIVGGWYLSADMQFIVMAVPMLLVMAHCQNRRVGRPEHFVAFTKQRQQHQQQQLTFIGGNEESAAGNQQRGLSSSVASTVVKQATNGRQVNLKSGKQRWREGEEDEEHHEYKPRNEIVISRKRVLAGYSLVLVFGLISALASVIYGILQCDVDLSYILKFVPHTVAILSKNIAMYTNSLFRFRAFALGLVLGHMLYLYEFKLMRLPKFVQQHGSKLTTTIFTIGFCVMFLPVLYPQGKIIVSHDMTVILMILTAGGIDIFLCTLIFLICIGKAPKPVLFFLNSPFWTVLSSLSLCAFLLHSEVIVLLTSQLNPPPTAQYSLLLFVFSATLIITYLLALALYLSFEMPVSRLIEAITRKYFSRTVRSDYAHKTSPPEI